MDLNKWLHEFKEILLVEFGESLAFIGIQGSRARQEESEHSDIDVVVLFDELTMSIIDR